MLGFLIRVFIIVPHLLFLDKLVLIKLADNNKDVTNIDKTNNLPQKINEVREKVGNEQEFAQKMLWGRWTEIT